MRLALILFIWFFCLKAYSKHATDTAQNITHFIIESLPKNTPHDASIYLADDESGWYPDIEEQRFTLNDEGLLELVLIHNSDSITYKLTRGSWQSVEARANGRALPNRTYHTSMGKIVYLTVDSWEDISVGSYAIYMYILLICAFQGLLLIVAINTIRNKNKVANTALSAALLLISLSLVGRASTFDPGIFNWEPRLILIPEVLLFTYGPLFLFYVHRLLNISFDPRKLLLYLSLFVIQFLIYLPYLFMDGQTFIYRLIDRDLFPIFAWSGLIALLFNTYFWFKSKNVIEVFINKEQLNDNQKKYINFLQSILNIKAIYLGIWALTAGIYMIGELFNWEVLSLVEQMIDLIWLLFSLLIFALAYYAIKSPEVFRVKRKIKITRSDESEIAQIADKLERLMDQEKTFRDPNLSLNSLAAQVPTSTHMLSQVINEHFQVSYSDYVNQYRIEEFIKRINEEKISFLTAALDVGFGSKPTFNRAFKKLKGKTPKEYFQE